MRQSTGLHCRKTRTVRRRVPKVPGESQRGIVYAMPKYAFCLAKFIAPVDQVHSFHKARFPANRREACRSGHHTLYLHCPNSNIIPLRLGHIEGLGAKKEAAKLHHCHGRLSSVPYLKALLTVVGLRQFEFPTHLARHIPFTNLTGTALGQGTKR